MSRVFELTRRNIQLLTEMQKKGGTVTQQEQSVYSAFSFYINTKELIKKGFIVNNGTVFADSNKKSWTITEKGKLLLKMLKKIDSLWQ